jgi:two-component system, NarL family, invasion response regulator UvrY
MSPGAGRAARASVGVIVVDDQEAFRRVAREVIEATPGFEALGEAACADEALALAEHVHPDLVLIDVRMPRVDGLETARRLHAAGPGRTIVLLSTEHVDELPACGAATFVRKEDFGPDTLRRLWAEHGGTAAAG